MALKVDYALFNDSRTLELKCNWDSLLILKIKIQEKRVYH